MAKQSMAETTLCFRNRTRRVTENKGASQKEKITIVLRLIISIRKVKGPLKIVKCTEDKP